MPLLWVFATVLATGLQVARNALQRGMIADAGPWGATLVRFLFGLPFSVAFMLVAMAAIGPGLHPQLSTAYWVDALTGAWRPAGPASRWGRPCSRAPCHWRRSWAG